MDPTVKLRHNIDALFGQGVSKHLPKNIEISFSKRTGRIREVYHNQKLLCTLRIDGGLAITPFFAQILMKSKKFKENCLEVDQESKPFVEDGDLFFVVILHGVGKVSGFRVKFQFYTRIGLLQ